jgi:hypothetical protein
MEKITEQRLMNCLKTRQLIIDGRVENLGRIQIAETDDEKDKFEDVLLIANPPVKEWATPGKELKFMVCAPTLFHQINAILVNMEEKGFTLDGEPVIFDHWEKVHRLVADRIREIGAQFAT